MSNNGQSIEIITRETKEYSRGFSDRVEVVSKKVDVSVLRNRFREFISNLQAMIDFDTPSNLPFELGEVQFSAEIAANGDFKLLGVGVGVEVSNAVTFVLQRCEKAGRESG